MAVPLGAARAAQKAKITPNCGEYVPSGRFSQISPVLGVIFGVWEHVDG